MIETRCGEGNRAVNDLGAVGCILPASAGDQDIFGRAAAGRHLAVRDHEAALGANAVPLESIQSEAPLEINVSLAAATLPSAGTGSL